MRGRVEVSHLGVELLFTGMAVMLVGPIMFFFLPWRGVVLVEVAGIVILGIGAALLGEDEPTATQDQNESSKGKWNPK